MSLLELSRLEARLRVVITEVCGSLIARIEACEHTERDMIEKITALEDRVRALMAKEELQKTSVSQNPVFDDEESDGSV